jgi:thiamine pyrophosphate-dependent acetolactate synthase large subunit-like protein
MPVEQPRLWHYPAGYCTLGCGLPNGIGAKLALPEQPVVVLAGDGGFMFTVQELVTAAELELPLPIILWNNSSLKQIRDDMLRRSIPTLGVNGPNPDFIALAKACNGNGVRVESRAEFTTALEQAWTTPTFTLIEVREGDAWLVD